MVVDITLRREMGQPFGFRLIGGSDFEIPLTVSRVRKIFRIMDCEYYLGECQATNEIRYVTYGYD